MCLNCSVLVYPLMALHLEFYKNPPNKETPRSAPSMCPDECSFVQHIRYQIPAFLEHLVYHKTENTGRRVENVEETLGLVTHCSYSNVYQSLLMDMCGTVAFTGL